MQIAFKLYVINKLYKINTEKWRNIIISFYIKRKIELYVKCAWGDGDRREMASARYLQERTPHKRIYRDTHSQCILSAGSEECRREEMRIESQ